MDEFDDLFASNMAAAGLSPTTRIGIAVSGGADSTALCILASRWTMQKSGLIGFIVDHGLRKESACEALIVQERIASLGIRSEILKCHWPCGIPMHGRLQEAARNIRYEVIHKACEINNVDVLLTAHHLDDQIELFIIRCARHSGLAGLAGIPFVSTMYRCMPENARNNVIQALLVARPLLGLRKNDLYEICKHQHCLWVEDPTNSSPIFLRNVVRYLLSKQEFGVLSKEIPPLIRLCRRLRTVLNKSRDFLLSEAVSIDEVFGYVIINLEKLQQVKPSEQSIKRLLVAILQFVAQKDKPPRGNIVQTLVRYLSSNQLKGALTLAGCNIFKKLRLKESWIMICASSHSKLPSSSQPVNIVWPCDTGNCHERFSSSFDKPVAMSSFCLTENKLEGEFDTRFLKLESPGQLLSEARANGIFSDRAFIALSEIRDRLSFSSTSNVVNGNVLKENESLSGIGGNQHAKVEIPCGHACYFMNRFWLAWGTRAEPEGTQCILHHQQGCDLASKQAHRRSTIPLWTRYMEEKDWIFLYQFAGQRKNVVGLLTDRHESTSCCEALRMNKDCNNEEIFNLIDFGHRHVLPCCFDITLKRVQDIVATLKRVPVPVRHGLPVFVTSQGSLISIPSLGFSLCPKIWVFSKFCPKVPLGGGCTSWL